MNINPVFLAALLTPRQTDAVAQETKARALFQAMQAKYSAATTLSVTTATKIYSEKGGKKRLTTSIRDQVEARRPSFFHEEKLSQKSGQAIQREESASDGKFVWVYEEKDKTYIKLTADNPASVFAASLAAPGDFFLNPDHSDAFTKPNPLVTMRYVGIEKIGGEACDKIEVHLSNRAE